MAKRFHHTIVEKKWQREWERRHLFSVGESMGTKKAKAYVLDMFPYPSAQGLHVGHPEGYTASDIVCRYLRMKGRQVMHPMGFDAFGLPAENFAIKTGTHPALTTAKNIKNMRKQIQSLGFSYDWDREVVTSDPKYYKWTQWVFVQLFKHGLAYEAFAPINWCPSCKTGLANEEVVNGKCERCGTVVTKKQIKQWLVKITDEKYIERLLHGLDKLDWPENIKHLQRNWIGRSEGASVKFKLEKADEYIEIFTTRPDTLFGATYIVVSPEHPLVHKITTPEQRRAVGKYQIEATRKSDLDRTDLAKEKTGIFTGAYAINPANEKKIPIWIADYVLSTYGTGAIMAVPAHDERDYAFAKKFKLPITQVVAPLFENTTDLKVRMDLPIETRRLIYGIVRNPKDNTYLCLDWPDQSWGSFVVGGIEDTEGPVDAAEREILEETGFKNLKFVSEVEWQVHTKFFAPHKNENRYGIAVGVVFDLLDQRQDPVSEEEKKKHTVRWISKSKVRDFVTHRNAKFIWDNYLHPSAFSGDGVMVNSGKADGMDSVKFKEVIVDKLDALTCKDKKTCLIVHGIGGHDQENWFPWLKKELVKNCWEALVPSMPETDHPSLGLWNDFLKKKSIQINEQSVLVGHSLGAPAVLNYLQLTGTKVDTVILVAPTNPLQHWESLKKDFAQADWDAVKKMSDEKNFNWKKIQRLAKRFIIIHSDNDPFVPVESISFYKERLPSAEVYLFSGKKHFSKSNGDMTSFPEILKFFPMQSAGASRTVNYKLRDWLFSRQRYWGEPIPIIHCEKCGNVPVPEEDLPLELPKVKKYEPTGTGESPLASIDKWVNTKCPQCGNKAKRETNTMPQWAGSNWYFLRYCDPKNEKLLADPEKLKQWLPVDLYVGGAEHAVLHLLYARFMYKFLYDIGTVPKECGDEPFTKLKNQGLILGQDNQKMSKSRGNVVNPDDVIKEYGADAMRMYEMFMGPFEDAKPWNTNGIVGMSRFLERIWQWGNTIVSLLAKGDQRVLVQNEGRKRILHQTIQKVTEDIENFRFNTAISQLMIYFKEVTVQGKVLAAEFLMTKEEFEIFLKLLSPFAPHLVAELWEKLGHQDMVDFEPWPVAEASHLQVSEISVAVQINGRVRDQLTVPAEASEEAVLKLALASDKVQKWLGGKKPKMAKYIKGRIITIAV